MWYVKHYLYIENVAEKLCKPPMVVTYRDFISICLVTQEVCKNELSPKGKEAHLDSIKSKENKTQWAMIDFQISIK